MAKIFDLNVRYMCLSHARSSIVYMRTSVIVNLTVLLKSHMNNDAVLLLFTISFIFLHQFLIYSLFCSGTIIYAGEFQRMLN